MGVLTDFKIARLNCIPKMLDKKIWALKGTLSPLPSHTLPARMTSSHRLAHENEDEYLS